MAHKLSSASIAAIEKKIPKPWDISIPAHKLEDLYGSWGTFFLKKQDYYKAAKYYEIASEFGAESKLLVNRSVTERVLANADEALKYSKKAARKTPSAHCKMEVLYGLYESNELAKADVYAHDAVKYFSGCKSKNFNDASSLIATNIKDCLGESLTPFISKNKEIFPIAMDIVRKARIKKVERPLWKTLKEQKMCDNTSIREKHVPLITPIAHERQELDFKVYAQTYFQQNWHDIYFLRKLKCHPTLFSPFFHDSSPKLKKTLCNENEILRKYMKILETRWPLYNRKRSQFNSRQQHKEHRLKHLNRIQYHIRRVTLNILQTVRTYRVNGDVEKLTAYIEETMGGYANIRTYRTLPWKFEFLCDIYNSLGLAIIDKFRDPLTDGLITKNRIPNSRLLSLLNVQKRKDSSIYEDIAVVEKRHLDYLNFIAKRENRLPFTEYNIERSYLYYEISKCHLLHNNHMDCVSNALKGVQEAKECKSNLWQFLNTIQLIKAQATLNKCDKIRELLIEAKQLSLNLKNDKLIDYIDMCNKYNEDDINIKKSTIATESLRRLKSSISAQSGYSNSIQRKPSYVRDLDSDDEMIMSYPTIPNLLAHLPSTVSFAKSGTAKLIDDSLQLDENLLPKETYTFKTFNYI